MPRQQRGLGRCARVHRALNEWIASRKDWKSYGLRRNVLPTAGTVRLCWRRLPSIATTDVRRRLYANKPALGSPEWLPGSGRLKSPIVFKGRTQPKRPLLAISQLRHILQPRKRVRLPSRRAVQPIVLAGPLSRLPDLRDYAARSFTTDSCTFSANSLQRLAADDPH